MHRVNLRSNPHDQDTSLTKVELSLRSSKYTRMQLRHRHTAVRIPGPMQGHTVQRQTAIQNQQATLEFCMKSYTLVGGCSLAEDKLDSFVPVTYGIAQLERSIEERNQRNPFLPDDPDMRDNAAGEILIACAKELDLGGTRPTGFKDLKQHILSLYNPQQETFSARFGLLVHIPSTQVQCKGQVPYLRM